MLFVQYNARNYIYLTDSAIPISLSTSSLLIPPISSRAKISSCTDSKCSVGFWKKIWNWWKRNKYFMNTNVKWWVKYFYRVFGVSYWAFCFHNECFDWYVYEFINAIFQNQTFVHILGINKYIYIIIWN